MMSERRTGRETRKHKDTTRRELPSLAKEGAKREPDREKHKKMLRRQKNGPVPLKARPGWFVQQPIISGLNQPPRLRPKEAARHFFMGAATPPWPRRGVSHQKISSEKQKAAILLHKKHKYFCDSCASLWLFLLARDDDFVFFFVGRRRCRSRRLWFR